MRRYRIEAPRAMLLLAAGSIIVIRLPYFFGYRTTLALASLVPFVAAISWLADQPRRFKINGYLSFLSLALIALIGEAMFRANTAAGFGKLSYDITQVATLGLLWGFGLLLFASARTHEEYENRVAAGALAPGAYIALNVLMHFAGMTATYSSDDAVQSLSANTPAETLGAIGIHTTRVVFPMDPSVNGMGVVAAAGFASAWILWSRSRRRAPLKTWNRASLVCMSACLIAVLLTDTRAALIAAVAIAAFVTWRRRPRVAPLLLVVIPLSALLVMTFSGWLTGLNLSGFLVSRSANDLATGSLRFEIWRPVWDTFAHASFFEQIFGFGANGQFTSGASVSYEYLFRSATNPLLTHVHNLGLQALLDMGIIGLAVLTVTAYGAAARLENYLRDRPAGSVEALLAGVLTVFVCGSTETTPTYRTQETLLYAMLLFGAASALPRIAQARATAPRVALQS